MVLLLPMTVILGYITETTGQHNIKEIHDLFANLFLGVVIVHLAAIVLNSLAIRQIIFQKMFWINEEIQPKVLLYAALIVCIVIVFSLWFMLT